MATLLDFSAEVIARALSSLQGQVPPALMETLERLAASDQLLDSNAIVKAVAGHVDRESPNDN